MVIENGGKFAETQGFCRFFVTVGGCDNQGLNILVISIQKIFKHNGFSP